MKKIKSLSNLAILSTIVGPISIIASCSSNNSSKIIVELTHDSSAGVSIKESKVEKGKDSTITLTIPDGKVVDTLEIKIGDKTLTKGTDYTFDDNNKIITIKGNAVTGGNVSVKVTVKNLIKIESIAVTKQPTRTSYVAGEKLDLTGMVVTAKMSDESKIDVTNECKTDPAAGASLAKGTSKVTVTHTSSGKTAEFTITVEAAVVTEIKVTTKPKTNYGVGENLNLTGMVVTATMSDSKYRDVTSNCTTLPVDGMKLTKDHTKVTVTHTPSGKTAEFSITVGDAVVTSIAVETPPKTSYVPGEKLDLTGMVVTAKMSDESKINVTNDCKTDPAAGTPLAKGTSKVTVTHKPSGKTTEFSITVNESFQSDTWTNVIDYANQGLAKLKEVYGVSTFIGLERKVTINEKEHVVRVIGEEHDTIAETSNKAALTFELVTVLSDSNGSEMTSIWDADNNCDYTNSVLRANLNGTGSGTKSFSSPALFMLPEELQNGIKTVKKTVAKTNSYTPTEYSDKLFPLTYTEMALSGSKYAKVEGTAYKYWTEHNTNDDRKKTDAQGSSAYYWLVSPSTDGSHGAWAVYAGGSVTYDNVNGPRGVSFGFCI